MSSSTPQTVTIKGYLCVSDSSNVHRPNFQFFTTDMSKFGYANVMEHTFTVELPADFNLAERRIAMLEQTKRDVTSEFKQRIDRLNDQIRSLQALEFTPSGEPSCQ